MNSLKSLCVIIVLSAITYGAYVSLTNGPTSDPPPEAAGWQESPEVELPGDLRAGHDQGQATVTTGGEAPPFMPQNAVSSPAVSSNPFTSSENVASVSGATGDDAAPPYMVPPVGTSADSTVPSAYPRTNYPDDPLSGVPGAATSTGGSAPATTSPSGTGASVATAPASATTGAAATGDSRYGDRYAATTAAATAPPAATSTPAADDPSQQFRKSLETIHRQLDAGKLAEAHLELSEWFDDPQLTAEEDQALMQLLDQLAGTVIYSRQHLLEPAYEAQQGDTLERVAEAYHVPWQLLAKINGLSAGPLQPGQMLKVVRGPFDAVVDLDQFTISLFLHGRYAGRFPIGIGNERPTPLGEYSVQNKLENPTYYGSEGVVDANDPANPLGEHWIDLGQQLGIHGTHEPQTIGQAAARGCIRLAPSHAHDVYDILSVGSRVIIRK